jgi:hypothetical protein
MIFEIFFSWDVWLSSKVAGGKAQARHQRANPKAVDDMTINTPGWQHPGCFFCQ